MVELERPIYLVDLMIGAFHNKFAKFLEKFWGERKLEEVVSSNQGGTKDKKHERHCVELKG